MSVLQPYYQDPSITLYHGDCFEILPVLGADAADMILTDPPYGVSWQGRTRKQQTSFDVLSGDDGSLSMVEALEVALKCLKRGRHVYVFGLTDFTDLPVASFAELIWDKEITGLGDLSIPWGPSHEKIAFGVYEISAANRKGGFGALTARIRHGSVLRSLRAHSGAVNRHPTEKPVDILRQMIESSTMMGETVLDPFVGSGSTLVAARLEGRKSIGIEIEEKYCEVAAKRLGQQSMFAMEEAV